MRINRTSPSAPPGIAAAAIPAARLSQCFIAPEQGETFVLHAHVTERDRTGSERFRLRYDAPFPPLQATAPISGAPVDLTAAACLEAMSNDYRLEDQPGPSPGSLPRVAFTVRWADAKGGGTLNLYRWVNWLADAGVEVCVYAPDPPPSWITLNARFHQVPDGATRYRSIREPLVVVYSVIELPGLLQHGQPAGKRIYHLCQGAEEFHLAPPPAAGLLAPNAAFDVLNALPVGRLVVSPHLRDYFDRKYGQRACLVTNGVDTTHFAPAPEPRGDAGDRRTVLCVGSPSQPLKGIETIQAAMTILAARRPGWRLHLVVAAGAANQKDPPIGGPGYTAEVRYGLDQAAMRDLYRSADAFVNASWYEGFGLPSVEAMACGLPVVQCDNHGLDGLVADGRDCLMASPRDAASIAGALDRILADPALRARLVEGARSTAGRLSLERQRTELLEVFGALTGTPLCAPRCAPASAPALSVVVPGAAPGPALQATLEGLRQQGDAGWEAVLVHDGAASEAMARLATGDRRLRLVAAEGTRAEALAAGLAAAAGERLSWLSPGEAFLPGKLALHLAAERLDPGLRLAHTAWRAGDAGATSAPVPTELQLLHLLDRTVIAGPSVVVHRSALGAAGDLSDVPYQATALALFLRAGRRFRWRALPEITCVTGRPSAGARRDSELAGGMVVRTWLEGLAFADLFPFLDLDHPDQASHALLSTLRVATTRDALAVRAGASPLLLERTSAWLGGLVGQRTRRACQEALMATAGRAASPALRDATTGLLRSLGPLT